MNVDRYKRYLDMFRHRIRRDPTYDVMELLAIEQKQWGPRMRLIKSLGEPVAGLGFTGVVVPNNVPTTNVTSTSSTTETCLLLGGTTTTVPANGSSPNWMWIPAGNFRAGQSWRYFAAGVFTSGATNNAYTFTTRIGTSTTITSNASVCATGALTANATVTAGPWWMEGHLVTRTMGGAGALGTMAGAINVELANAVAGTNTFTGVGITPVGAGIALDTTVAEAFCPDVVTSTTGASIQLTQFMLVAWD